MRTIKPSIHVEFYHLDGGDSIEKSIESSARTCYKSEEKITDGTAAKLIEKLIKRGHEAMLEFGYARARIIADRGLTHELVRHRIASFAQESTRYCNYTKGQFNSEITVIEQPGIEHGTEEYHIWSRAMRSSEENYTRLIELGVKPEIARSVLPIGLKTEIVISANLREWRHIFKQRCSSKAHPIIRGVMLEALSVFAKKSSVIYGDLATKYLSKARPRQDVPSDRVDDQ